MQLALSPLQPPTCAVISPPPCSRMGGAQDPHALANWPQQRGLRRDRSLSCDPSMPHLSARIQGQVKVAGRNCGWQAKLELGTECPFLELKAQTKRGPSSGLSSPLSQPPGGIPTLHPCPAGLVSHGTCCAPGTCPSPHRPAKNNLRETSWWSHPAIIEGEGGRGEELMWIPTSHLKADHPSHQIAAGGTKREEPIPRREPGRGFA